MRCTGGGGRGRVRPSLLRALSAAVLAAGCQAAGSDESAATAAENASPSAGSAMPDSSADSLRLRLDIPAQVPAGATLPITLHIENTTDRTLTLHLVGRTITFDIIVERPDGVVVWRRLEGAVVPAILRLDTLPAGEEIVLQDTWDQRSNAGEAVPAGEYRVRGEVLTEGEALGSGVRAVRVGG